MGVMVCPKRAPGLSPANSTLYIFYWAKYNPIGLVCMIISRKIYHSMGSYHETVLPHYEWMIVDFVSHLFPQSYFCLISLGHVLQRPLGEFHALIVVDDHRQTHSSSNFWVTWDVLRMAWPLEPSPNLFLLVNSQILLFLSMILSFSWREALAESFLSRC